MCDLFVTTRHKRVKITQTKWFLEIFIRAKIVRPEVFCKKDFARFTRKHLCQGFSVFRPQACNFIKKEFLAQVFSCKFCEIFKNNFFAKHLLETASVFLSSLKRRYKMFWSLHSVISKKPSIRLEFTIFATNYFF